jgi:hypothetical protein
MDKEELKNRLNEIHLYKKQIKDIIDNMTKVYGYPKLDQNLVKVVAGLNNEAYALLEKILYDLEQPEKNNKKRTKIETSCL